MKNLSTNSSDTNSSDTDLHSLFKKYGCNAKEWLRKCAFLLPEIHCRRVWAKKGFSSIYEYAAKLAGMSKSSVDDALWVMRKIEDKPALKRVAEEKGINRVKPVANIATKGTEEFWAEKARDMNRNALRLFVRGIKEQESSNGHPVAVNSENSWADPKTQPEKPEFSTEKLEVSMQLNPGLAKRLQELQKRENFEDLIKEFLDFVETKDEEKKPEPVATKSRYIPVKIKRFVVDRTGAKCAFPGCGRAGDILHHTQRFALEKIHDPDRIVLLCKAHERLAHLGLIENEDSAPTKWSLRKHPDRTDHKWWVDQKVWLRR